MQQQNMPYTVYSDYLKNIYGEKVYKLPVNLPATCPNRDGKLGVEGCYFCSAKGAGFESHDNVIPVEEQLTKNMDYIGRRYGAKKFIAYFQNYSNTYMDSDAFKRFVTSACIDNIVELDIATRPDCLTSEHLDVLKKLSDTKGVRIVIELGLQTTNEESLKRINRGHGVQAFIDAVQLVHDYGFAVCTHLIMNLPWDKEDEPMKMAQLMNALNIEMVKLHSLYIAKGTVFADMYERGVLGMNTMDDYVVRVVSFLSHLRSECAIQRLVGRAPAEETLFCNWNTSWWKIRDKIVEKMLNENIYQGKIESL